LSFLRIGDQFRWLSAVHQRAMEFIRLRSHEPFAMAALWQPARSPRAMKCA
jgi:putative SOS response-associated peptidase YedK